MMRSCCCEVLVVLFVFAGVGMANPDLYVCESTCFEIKTKTFSATSHTSLDLIMLVIVKTCFVLYYLKFLETGAFAIYF